MRHAQNTMLISVIIPSYNREQSIIDAIKSVIHQGIDAIEILVCDDFSTDNTEQVVKTYMRNHKNVHFLQREDKEKGANWARNNGIVHSNGKYLVFLDSDDVLTNNSLAVRLEVFESNPNVDLVYGDVEINGRVHRFDEIQNFNQNSYIWEELSLCPFSVMMMKRDVFDSVPLLDTSLPSWQDDNMILNLNKHKKTLYHCGETVACMRQVDSNITSNYWKRYDGLKTILKLYEDDIVREKGYIRFMLWKIRLINDWVLAKKTDATGILEKIVYKIFHKITFSVCNLFFRHIYG